MAGIYIPGMKMPEEGCFTTLIIYDNGLVAEGFFPSRDSLVKAIPVLDHGNLIDIDATDIHSRAEKAAQDWRDNYKVVSNEYYEGVMDGWNQAVEVLSSAPILIPSDQVSDDATSECES